MQNLTDRQHQLLEWLQAQSSLSIAEVQERFAISTPTAYREVRALVESGLAYKTNGGIKLAPQTQPEHAENQCFYCGGALNERTTFVIQMQDGTQRKACCAHCGLLTLKLPDVQAALASEFLHGRMINARQAVFLFESALSLCCEPSVLCFANPEDARRFQVGFGGQICDLEQASLHLEQSMDLKTE